MEKPPPAEEKKSPVLSIAGLNCSWIGFDYLEYHIRQLKPRLSKLQEALFQLMDSVCKASAKGGCRLSIAQMAEGVRWRMPGHRISLVGVRYAIKILLKRELIIKEGVWRGRNVYTTIESFGVNKGPKGIQIPIEVATDPSLSWPSKQIFSRIEYMLRDGKRIYINWTNQRLAEDLNLSELTVDKGLSQLRREKYLIIRKAHSPYREIGLHPEWKELHSHLIDDFKKGRQIEFILHRSKNPEIRAKYLKKGVIQETPDGKILVNLPSPKGDSFAGSRNGKGDSFAGSGVIVLQEVNSRQHIDFIESSRDFEFPNKDINKDLKDKKLFSKEKSSNQKVATIKNDLSCKGDPMSCSSRDVLQGESPCGGPPSSTVDGVSMLRDQKLLRAPLEDDPSLYYNEA